MPQPAAGPDQGAKPGQVSRRNPQRARLNQDVADRRRLDRPGHHGQPAGVGGELAQQLVPGAAADQVHGVGVPARQLLNVQQGPPVRERGVHWVRPELVAQVGFSEWTDAGELRHPRFQGLRDDKAAREVVREVPSGS